MFLRTRRSTVKLIAIATAAVLASASLLSIPASGSGSSAAIFTMAQSVPPGANLVELRRWYTSQGQFNAGDHRAGTTPPAYPYANEGTLGFVSSTPFAGSHAIYECERRYHWNDISNVIDFFTTTATNCEGAVIAPNGVVLIGYVSTTQIAGTTPLYRCRDDDNHFDSLSGGCEGHTGEGILGYV